MDLVNGDDSTDDNFEIYLKTMVKKMLPSLFFNCLNF